MAIPSEMSMCEDRHPLIVHQERKCPMCLAEEEIDLLKGKINDMELELEEARRRDDERGHL